MDAPPKSARVELILGELDQLPTLPAVATRLLELTTSDRSSASDVASVIEIDPALTTKILAMVRRASVGAREVSTVDRAIVILGFEAVRNAVLAVQIHGMFEDVERGTGTPLDRTEFWKHSLAVGCAARLVAERMSLNKRRDEAFVCGLLHDLGKLALDACLPKSYGRAVRQARASGRCLCDVERELLGIDHTVAGKRLAARWKLPASIVEAVWLHHLPPAALPESIGSADLVGIVHLADRIVCAHHIGLSSIGHADSPEPLAEELGLNSDVVSHVVDALAEQMERNCQLIGLNELDGTAMYARAVGKANSELARVNTVLADANRRLTIRARCFDALGRFTRSLSLDDTAGTACLAAAKCVRDVLELDAAIGFYCGPREDLYHVGASTTDGDRVEVLPTPNNGAAPEPGGWYSAAGVSLGPAPTTVEPVVQQFQRMLGAGPVRMWPMVHSGFVIGGILVPNRAESTAPMPSWAEECEALSLAFGLAVAGAADRARSDRLNEELAHANRQLHQARRELVRARSLTMIAEMAAGAAHELNNPLAVISGRAQMLGKGATDPDGKRAAEIIDQHAQRASDIVTELVRFAKPDAPELSSIALADWLEGLRAHWIERSSLGPTQLQIAVADPAVRVRADENQLREVFDALLANAVEAVPPEKARLLINSDCASSDDKIVVTVADNGRGMDPEILEHAVDPFYSHRTAGRGRGMGLSRASRLATNNGGRLWLESSPGVGTTVYVELPAARP